MELSGSTNVGEDLLQRLAGCDAPRKVTILRLLPDVNSVFPKILEPLRTQLGIPHCVLNVLVTYYVTYYRYS